MRRAQNADTHALKQPRLSQNISPVWSSLYWLSRLTCISSLKARNERKTLIYTQLKISRYNQHFSLFLDEFLETDLRPVYCSLTTAKRRTSRLAGYQTAMLPHIAVYRQQRYRLHLWHLSQMNWGHSVSEQRYEERVQAA